MIGAIIIGGVAGWLAGILMKAKSQGVLINIVLGLIGGALGGWVFRFFGFTPGSTFIPQLITAVVGASIVIYLYRILNKK